jgi:hypothetical protein
MIAAGRYFLLTEGAVNTAKLTQKVTSVTNQESSRHLATERKSAKAPVVMNNSCPTLFETRFMSFAAGRPSGSPRGALPRHFRQG